MANSLSNGHRSPRSEWSASCSSYCSLGTRWRGNRTGCPASLSKFIVIGVTGRKTKLHHGKQTLRQLMKHNTGVSNIEITDQNIRAFSSTAKKYGLDFALKKDTSEELPRYLVFFKGRDADVITAAFREFSAKNLSREKAPSIRRKLEKAQEQSKTQHKEQERGEKVKTRERSVER